MIDDINVKVISITCIGFIQWCDGYDFNIDIINDDEYNAVQKELLMMFEGFCIFLGIL